MFRIQFRYRRKGIQNYNSIVKEFQNCLRNNGQSFKEKAVAAVKKELDNGDSYDANSPIWKQGKGGKSVLYNTGFMKNQPKAKLRTGRGNNFVQIDVGFLDKRNYPGTSTNIQDVVNVVTQGASWEPSAAQRKAFWAKVKKQLPPGFKAEYKSRWTIPARDFLGEALGEDMLLLFNEYVAECREKTIRKLSK